MGNSIKRIVRAALNFIFPKGRREAAIERMSAEEFLKSVARATPTEKPFIEAIFSYKDPLVKTLISLVKYKRNAHSAFIAGSVFMSIFGEELADLVNFSGNNKPLLVPIPIGKARLKERGYNQVEFIADEIIKHGGEAFFVLLKDAIIKSRETEHQTALKSRGERLKNLKGSFEVPDKTKVSGKIIFLLDDVTTTGATFDEARKTLLERGAREVRCVAIAH